jgi:hypothetical protein
VCRCAQLISRIEKPYRIFWGKLNNLKIFEKLRQKLYLGSPQAIALPQATAQAIVRSHRTSVKYTRTTDEMATSYRTKFVRCHRTASYDRTTACGDFVVLLR